MRGRGGGTPAAPSRIVVSLRADAWDALAERAAAAKVPLTRLGVVGGTALTLPDLLDVPIADLRAAWQNALV